MRRLTSKSAASSPIAQRPETEVVGPGSAPLQSDLLGGSGRTLMSGIAKSPSGNLRLGWTGSRRRRCGFPPRRPPDTPEPSSPLPMGDGARCGASPQRMKMTDRHLIEEQGVHPMHQIVLITALSATTGLFGGGKHCGKGHHGHKAVAASCYSASPCGATYASPYAAPVASMPSYPATPQAVPAPMAVPPAPTKASSSRRRSARRLRPRSPRRPTLVPAGRSARSTWTCRA